MACGSLKNDHCLVNQPVKCGVAIRLLMSHKMEMGRDANSRESQYLVWCRSFSA